MGDGVSSQKGWRRNCDRRHDPPIKTNNQSHQGHSGVFVPQRDKCICGTCFYMVSAHPSVPDTFDDYGILAQAEMRGVRKMIWSRVTGTSGG